VESATGERVSGARLFSDNFENLTGNPPFRWQRRLFDRFVAADLPSALDLPTGLGKTSVMAIWLLARAQNPRLPRRLIYVVDRRVVVDQATAEAEKLRAALKTLQLAETGPLLLPRGGDLPLSTLRGKFADNREWLQDPGQPAIIVGTVDMIGSRLLFEGYGVSRRMRPYQAGMLGADTLVVLDEAHLCPPFEALLRGIAGEDSLKPRGEERRSIIPGFRLLTLSATGRTDEGDAFRLEPEDADRNTQPTVSQRYTAAKRLSLHDLESGADLAKALAERAWALGEGNSRVLVFCDSYEVALKVATDLRGRLAATEDEIEVLVGKRRVFERERLVERLTGLGFIHPAKGERPARATPAFLVATSAGEVGIDLDADHMVCDLVAFERMVQRLGRVNRRGGEGRLARIDVLCLPQEKPNAGGKDDEKARKVQARAALLAAAKALLEALPKDEGGGHNASSSALAGLKTQVGSARIAAATTPAPLHPALDRAVVDAWSLTSLPEHPGRPEPQPWLRGWVDDDEPQVQVVWRRFLPWRRGERAPVPSDVEAFFAAARPHLSEVLEAPVDRVVDMLIARAKAVLTSRKAAAEDGERGAPATPETSGTADDAEAPGTQKEPETRQGLLVLTPAREFKRLQQSQRGARREAGLGAWTVQELAELPLKGKSADRDALARLLTNATVVVSASLGGLDDNGLLSPAAAGPPTTADAPGPEEDRWAPGFRVQIANADGVKARSVDWRPALRLPLATDDEDDPQMLTVLVSRGSKGGRDGDPAISRRAQGLAEHGDWAADAAGKIADALGLSAAYRAMLVAAARAHDRGKDRPLWQNAMAGREPPPAAPTPSPPAPAIRRGCGSAPTPTGTSSARFAMPRRMRRCWLRCRRSCANWRCT